MLVCIIEDHREELKATVDLVKHQLEKFAPEVRSAQSGVEGEEVLMRSRENGEYFDLIIIDLKLPRLKGEPERADHELPELARSLFPDSTIIMRTAYAGRANPPRMILRGVDFVMDKTSAEAPEEFSQAITEYPIMRRFRNIFGVEGFGSVSGYRERLHEHGGSLTLELNALISDILTNYGKLSDEAREEINRHITIHEKNGEYVIGDPPAVLHGKEGDNE